jgi:hypothetical protein
LVFAARCPFLSDLTRDTFYIHPKSQLLCLHRVKRIDYKARRRREKAKIFRYINPNIQLHKSEGIWYEWSVKKEDNIHLFYKAGEEWDSFAKFNDSTTRAYGTLRPWVWKEFISETGEKTLRKYYLPHPSVSRRQLSRKELKKYKISNDSFVLKPKCRVCGAVNCSNHRA